MSLQGAPTPLSLSAQPSTSASSPSPCSPPLPSPATIFAEDDSAKKVCPAQARIACASSLSRLDSIESTASTQLEGDDATAAPEQPSPSAGDTEANDDHHQPLEIDDEDSASALTLLALGSFGGSWEDRRQHIAHRCWPPSAAISSAGSSAGEVTPHELSRQVSQDGYYSSAHEGGESETQGPIRFGTFRPGVPRAAGNKKRRANEDERIRHFGWSMVKIDATKKSGAAGGHCWVHPVHGTATSKKAVFRFHANEPPVKKVKPGEAGDY